MEKRKFKTTDEYISSFPKNLQALLNEMRAIVTAAAPQAEEIISYNMPALKQKSVLVYYAAYEHHIGFYPTASGIANFQQEIAKYKSSKGALQFPLDKPLPKTLIAKMVKFRVKEQEEKNKKK